VSIGVSEVRNLFNLKFSKFTLIDIFDNRTTNIITSQNEKGYEGEIKTLHETYYGGCNQPKN